MFHLSHAQLPVIVVIGIVVGFLSGLFGKGGSAIGTPALQIFARVPPLIALASPLPSAIPTTLAALFAYKGKHLINKQVVVITTVVGIPATLLGSYASDYVGGNILMLITALFVICLGVALLYPFVFDRKHHLEEGESVGEGGDMVVSRFGTASIALAVGLLSGLLANSGGVLFAPLFIKILKLPAKSAMACSLMVAATLAVPGTLAHWGLGHIDWMIVLIFSLGSIPGSFLGAKLAISLRNATLEVLFGFMLMVFGSYDLFFTIHQGLRK